MAPYPPAMAPYPLTSHDAGNANRSVPDEEVLQ